MWLATVFGVKFVEALAPEYHVVETEHVESGHTGNQCHEVAHEGRELEAGGDDFVFREETCKGRDTGDGETSDEEADIGNGHILVQTSHILLEVAADNHDDGTGAEEEQGLEHGVGKEVEHTGHITQTTLVVVDGGTYAKGYQHIGYLRDGREGQTTLDVALTAGYGCGIECGEGSNVGYIVQGFRRVGHPDGEQAGHLVYTSHNHGGGVDER